jgi:hypothetical protein
MDLLYCLINVLLHKIMMFFKNGWRTVIEQYHMKYVNRERKTCAPKAPTNVILDKPHCIGMSRSIFLLQSIL